MKCFLCETEFRPKETRFPAMSKFKNGKDRKIKLCWRCDHELKENERKEGWGCIFKLPKHLIGPDRRVRRLVMTRRMAHGVIA